MSDYHEMFESWDDLLHDYDPNYQIDNGRVDDEHVRPIDPDKWSDDDTDYKGGF